MRCKVNEKGIQGHLINQIFESGHCKSPNNNVWDNKWMKQGACTKVELFGISFGPSTHHLVENGVGTHVSSY